MSKTKTNQELVVAGAGADGHGVISGWRGRDALTRAELVEHATRASLPAEWLPAPKDADVQLGRAVQSVAGSTYSAEHVRKRDQQSPEPREWSTRWLLVARTQDVAAAGQKFGEVVLVATLYANGELAFDCANPALVSEVRAEYERRVGAESYVAADVTRWLGEVHRYRLGAVRIGFGWYVPRVSRAIAEAIESSFNGEARWGDDWISPPLPVASSEQLAMGIAKGLCTEVAEVLGELTIARERARERKAGSDIGPRAAETYMARLTRVGSRVLAYANQIGRDGLRMCQESIHDAMVELDAVLEGGVDGNWNGIWKRAHELNDAA